MEKYQTEAVDVKQFNESAKARVEKIVKESPDMITALEHVGAMYGIAPTHFTVQPELKVLKVVDDHVLTPPDVRANTKAIVCSIGGVLDHISQRVNDKLDERHDHETKEGRSHPHISPTANPNKGEVIERHVDSNGDEILVYDSGLMDMANTKEAHAKADELKREMKVPMYNPKAMKAREDAYFTREEDDIRIKTNANIDDETLNSNEPKPMDLSKEIQESAFHMDLINHYHDTDYLGYELLQEQGFDFVRPTSSFALESDVAETRSKVTPDDIKHMKFDNTEITKAIKCFTKARMEQSNNKKGNIDYKEFSNSQAFREGLDHLEKQFDCKIILRFGKAPENNNDLYTTTFGGIYNGSVTVSKSKGFQLNGLPIQIMAVNNALDEEMSNDANLELFGQFMCASLCHEIFHNIVMWIRNKTNVFIFTSTSAMAMALSTDKAAARREIFTQFAKTIDVDGKKLDKGEQKRLIKKLCYISALSDNEEEIKKVEDSLKNKPLDGNASANDYADQIIQKYERGIHNYEKKIPNAIKRGDAYNKHPKRYKVLRHIASGLTSSLVGCMIGLPMLKLMPNKADAVLSKQYHDYLEHANKEEYYCDMFAGMYNLPLSFVYGYKGGNHPKVFVSNDFDDEKLKRLDELEKQLRTYMMIKYPTDTERNYTAYKIAKQILDSKMKISKEAKEYCEWLIKNYSNTDKIGLESHSDNVFDAKEANDLDEHIQNLILNNGIVVTESYHNHRN